MKKEINEINPYDNKLDYNEIERVLSKNPENAESIALSIIQNKGTSLNANEISSLFKHTNNPHSIAMAIVNAKKETLEPNDMVKLSYLDNKNLDELKAEMCKYNHPEVVDMNAQNWAVKDAQNHNRKFHIKEYQLRSRIRKILNEILK